MDPLEFQQDTIKWCSFHIAASAGSLADADDAEQIIREKLLAFDEEKLPGDCRDKKAWALNDAQLDVMSEIRTRRWMNSTKGKFKHASLTDVDYSVTVQAVDETYVLDAETIRDLVSDEEWALITMRYYEGLSFTEIGARLNLSPRGAGYRHKILMAKIRERLEIT